MTTIMESPDVELNRDGPAIQNVLKSREALIEREKEHRSDHEFRQGLSPIARQAAAIVSNIRLEEKKAIWAKQEDHELFPGMMFSTAKNSMESTRLWKIVKQMPKGALLHAHLGATVDLDFVFSTALECPGICISALAPLASHIARENVTLKFSIKNTPEPTPSVWSQDYVPNSLIPITQAAASFPSGGQHGFISWIKNRCSITQDESLLHHLGVDDVWRKLQGAFLILSPVLYYEPVMRRFLRELFKVLKEDKIDWVELRTVFITPFLLTGQESPAIPRSMYLAGLFVEEIEAFKNSEEGKGFWGCRFIWTSMRGSTSASILEDMRQCIEVKKGYPDLIAGYDLVGQEDLGRTLKDLTPEILWFRDSCAAAGVDIPFFFHAGECLGDGDETDQNLFDAILFGTRRIGHGFSLYKHPTLIDMVKEKKILIECCPISNEVLRYTASIMSHPLPALLARGVKAALSNDDPALLGQGTSGVTHDFWQALQGWENLGLEGLGSLAQNSLRWSVFEDQTEEEWLSKIDAGAEGSGLKAKRITQWNEEWEVFCHWIVAEFGNTA